MHVRVQETKTYISARNKNLAKQKNPAIQYREQEPAVHFEPLDHRPMNWAVQHVVTSPLVSDVGGEREGDEGGASEGVAGLLVQVPVDRDCHQVEVTHRGVADPVLDLRGAHVQDTLSSGHL